MFGGASGPPRFSGPHDRRRSRGHAPVARPVERHGFACWNSRRAVVLRGISTAGVRRHEALATASTRAPTVETPGRWCWRARFRATSFSRQITQACQVSSDCHQKCVRAVLTHHGLSGPQLPGALARHIARACKTPSDLTAPFTAMWRPAIGGTSPFFTASLTSTLRTFPVRSTTVIRDPSTLRIVPQ